MLNPRKESKSHTKNDEHYATKGDLKETEHRLDIAILNTKHEIKETELQLKHEIKETELILRAEITKIESGLKAEIVKLGAIISNVEARLTGEIKALSNSKWFDRSLAIAILGFFITPYIKPVGTMLVSLMQYFS